MEGRVLVAYATRYGSTAEVAEAVAATLRDRGVAADLAGLGREADLSAYNGLVLGAPLYMFRWHKQARHFLSRNREWLTQHPVAVFALGPFNDDVKELADARKQLDKELARYQWFEPADVVVFGGKFDPAGLRFPHNLIPALKQLPLSDVRDWNVIRRWAAGVGDALLPAGG